MLNKIKIVLASASPRRRELLAQIGIKFEVEKAEREEVFNSTIPEEVVKELSLQKAEEVAERVKADIVIGADTVVAVDGMILGKPKNRDDAEKMISQIQGKTHEVITGVSIILCGQFTYQTINFAEVTKVHVFPMSENMIKAYVNRGESMDKAGAYGIQGAFAAYVSGIEGDYNNVVGLPVGRLYQELLLNGIDLLEESDNKGGSY